MAAISTKKSLSDKKLGSPVLNKNMKSYSQDPFFVKKARDAKELIVKYGVPKTSKQRT